ncbi:hypothetical protein MBOU_55540 [Mycobacterium bourgelatii]|uniref:Uncharacterized protein n=1 Tax=Mycobacterium bourgelatii TaxID=1273442 RepID=A0A7I9YY69_MYCBU|nr:hypothetical protein MBOU_55540 [Mycobacterium bourgelatii]
MNVWHERPSPSQTARKDTAMTAELTNIVNAALAPQQFDADIPVLAGAQRQGDVEGDPFDGPVAMRLAVGGSWSTVGRTRLG